MDTAFAAQLADFYRNVAYSALVLLLPLLAFCLIVSAGLCATIGLVRRRLNRTFVFAFVFSFALVGGVAGTIAGATLESIVGASLAAILGLVSSLLTYLFGKESLRYWRPVIPLAIIALLLSTLAGLVIGGSRRTQILNDTDRLAAAKADHEQVHNPVERETRLLLVRKCIAERAFEKAVDDCT